MNVIAAVNIDWGIGFEGAQSIVIPEDRRHFRELTVGGVIIAGRKTFEDLGKPLPNRKNIILTRDRSFLVDGAVTAHSVDEVLAEIADDDPGKVFVIGGGEVYRLLLHRCTVAYITRIEAAPQSDTFFPNLDAAHGWHLEHRGEANESNGVKYSFCLYRNQTPDP